MRYLCILIFAFLILFYSRNEEKRMYCCVAPAVYFLWGVCSEELNLS